MLAARLAAIALMIAFALASAASDPLTSPAAAVVVQSGPTAPTIDELERDKLQAETAKLRQEARNLADDQGTVAAIARIAPFLTAIVAIVGVLLTLAKQIQESGRQATLDRNQRDQDRIQRFDEQFNRMVDNLGAADAATRAAATTQIATYLKPEHAAFHEQVFLLLLAALRYPRNDVGDKILVRTFQTAARDRLPVMRSADPELHLDLSYAYLERVDLSHMDLSDADVAYADLHGARLSETSLRKARAYKTVLAGAYLHGADLLEADLGEADLTGARLRGTNLVSAKLRDAIATRAQFQQARMQEAHFEGATLIGARFEQAVLTNAYFNGAIFDDAALSSIATGAIKWREANFDPDVRAQLEQLSADQHEK